MLNKEQLLAVQTIDGPLRIIAGAGTGKTFTLVNRVAYLIKEKKVNPEKILILTFTNKAAKELKDRLKKMGIVGSFAMTFHSLSAKLLRKYWSKDFKIIDSNEKEKFLDSFNEEEYKKYLEENNLIDFEGLLTQLLLIWDENTDILHKCQQFFDFVLVDEYQDVNEIQIEIIKKLVEPHKNICVVGDSDQTIYSWRGAKASTMIDFKKLFSDAKSITLIKNYRNPPNILKGAEALIKNNENRIEKRLESEISSDNKIQLWESKSLYQQNEILYYLLERYLGSTSNMFMADQLDNENDEDFRPLSDIAILYRTQYQGKAFAELLSKKGYPYQISSSEYFWQKKEIVKLVEDLEKLSSSDYHSERLKVAGESSFSEWLSNFLDKYIENNKFSNTQENRLKQLIPFSVQFESLSSFIDGVKTEQDADNLIFSDRINLLTLHAAKGLEFPIVLIFGLEEGEIPYKKSKDDNYLLSEERRLLYVGMTRATEELHLFYNKSYKRQETKRSRFLSEIGIENIEYQSLPEERVQKFKRKEMKKSQMKLF